MLVVTLALGVLFEFAFLNCVAVKLAAAAAAASCPALVLGNLGEPAVAVSAPEAHTPNTQI